MTAWGCCKKGAPEVFSVKMLCSAAENGVIKEGMLCI